MQQTREQSPSQWILPSHHVMYNLGRSLHTYPPESTGETTRTKGGSKGKLSCCMENKKKFKRINKIIIISKENNKCTWSNDLLYKRNWAEYSLLLPFLLRPASHYAMDYLGLPCNRDTSNLTGHTIFGKLEIIKSNLMWELTSLTWRAIHKGCHWLVRLNKYLWNKWYNHRLLLKSAYDMLKQ